MTDQGRRCPNGHPALFSGEGFCEVCGAPLAAAGAPAPGWGQTPQQPVPPQQPWGQQPPPPGWGQTPPQQPMQQPMQQPHERGVTRIDDRRDGTISDAQKRALWRKALTLGYEGPRAHAFLLERWGVEPSRATRMQASRLLDVLSEEERRASQAGGHAAE